MKPSINIKKIAELAEVSVATVSRVINQNGRFSAETESRVRQIIEEYGYTPNLVAKGLRTSRFPVMGAILPDVQNSHFASLIVNLEIELYKRGYSLIICNTNEDETLEKNHYHALIQQKVSGIFIISGRGIKQPADDTPIVYLDRRPVNLDSKEPLVIESDNRMGGYLAAKSLTDSGCKRIALLRTLSMDQNQKDRYNGYQKALKESTGKPAEELVFTADNAYPDCAEHVIEKEIRNGCRFDGLMCMTDTLAIGACAALLKQNIRIPDDVCLTGFDDAPITRFFYPSITTIRQRVEEMAVKAVSVMCGDRNKTGQIYQIPVDLVVRQSTKNKQ